MSQPPNVPAIAEEQSDMVLNLLQQAWTMGRPGHRVSDWILTLPEQLHDAAWTPTTVRNALDILAEYLLDSDAAPFRLKSLDLAIEWSLPLVGGTNPEDFRNALNVAVHDSVPAPGAWGGHRRLYEVLGMRPPDRPPSALERSTVPDASFVVVDAGLVPGGPFVRSLASMRQFAELTGSRFGPPPAPGTDPAVSAQGKGRARRIGKLLRGFRGGPEAESVTGGPGFEAGDAGGADVIAPDLDDDAARLTIDRFAAGNQGTSGDFIEHWCLAAPAIAADLADACATELSTAEEPNPVIPDDPGGNGLARIREIAEATGVAAISAAAPLEEPDMDAPTTPDNQQVPAPAPLTFTKPPTTASSPDTPVPGVAGDPFAGIAETAVRAAMEGATSPTPDAATVADGHVPAVPEPPSGEQPAEPESATAPTPPPAPKGRPGTAMSDDDVAAANRLWETLLGGVGNVSTPASPIQSAPPGAPRPPGLGRPGGPDVAKRRPRYDPRRGVAGPGNTQPPVPDLLRDLGLHAAPPPNVESPNTNAVQPETPPARRPPGPTELT
jgi:hypothetical protein